MQTQAAPYDKNSPDHNRRMAESRGGVILREYWNSLRHGRPFPTEAEINPDDISQIWEYCFLVSIDQVTQHAGYRYSYLGTKLIEAYGDDIHNPEIISNLISTSDTENKKLVSNFDEVLATRQPVADESEFMNLNRLQVKYRVSLFPIGSEGRVTHILGCMRWRLY